ncbi:MULTISPECIES: VOC family protein [Luteimonas]|uniref:VOC family protein n=1 Tax=Luteimonas TaxID=83614 RepID=UPI000C796314|nr:MULTISPECIES: VOC family protein [Luteimonas]
MDATDRDLRIDYIEFDVVDLDASKRFYAAAFDWTFTDHGPAYCEFRDGGRMTGGFAQTDVVRTGGPLVILYARDLAAARRRVEAAGASVEPTFAFPGGHRFHFRDPSGHTLAVWSDADA